MCKRILGLKDRDVYTGNEIGRRLEIWLGKNNLPSKNYQHGTINGIARSKGIKPYFKSEGGREKYLGLDMIPLIEEEIVKAKKKKARTVGKQPRQSKKEINIPTQNVTPILTQKEAHGQMTIEDLEQPPFIFDKETLRKELYKVADQVAEVFGNLLW